MQQKIKLLARNKFIQGGVFFTAASFLIGFINYGFNVLTGRALGPAGYGEITALFSYITVFAVPFTVISTIVVQKIGAQTEKNREYAAGLEQWLIKRIKRWSFLFVVLLILTPFMPQLTNLSPIVAYTVLPLLILIFFTAFYDGALQGLHLLTVFSIMGIGMVVIKLLGPILAFTGIFQLEFILFFIVLSLVARIIFSKIVFNKSTAAFREKSQNSDKGIREVFQDKQIWITTISLLSINLLNNADIIFVKKFFSAYDAGIYSSWSLFAKIILYIISPLLSVSFIFFTSKKEEQKHGNILMYSLLFIVLAGIISYLGYTFFSPFLVTTLFGQKFITVIPYLSSASIFGILYVAILYFNNYFLAKRSIQALILSGILPFYILGLFIIPKTITAITQLNIIFATTSICVYLVAYWISVSKK